MSEKLAVYDSPVIDTEELQNLVTLCEEHHHVAERMAPLYPFGQVDSDDVIRVR